MWATKIRLLKRILTIQVELDKRADCYLPNLYVIRRLIRELGELKGDLETWLKELEDEIK